MFTGIVRALGRLERGDARGALLRMQFAAPAELLAPMQLGDSIAVNGVCLTVAALHPQSFEADVSAETLARTTLGALAPGEVVNLEPALRVGDSLGGHWVSGHVDGVGSIATVDDDAGAQRWRFRAPRALMRYLAVKGSVAVDGVSLTINDIDDHHDGFGVTLIPHTLTATRFAHLRPGAAVNVEVDLIARYAERLLAQRGTR